MKLWRFTALVAIFACATIGLVACGGGDKSDTGTSPSADFPQQPTAGSNPPSNPSTNPTPAPGVTVEVLESNFDEDRCTQLTDPKYAGLAELTHKAKLTNGSGENIYSKVAIFHSNLAGCGATGEGPGGTTGLVTGDTSIDSGKSGTVTYHFPIGDNMCGRYQLDDTWRPTNTFVIGKVIDTGRNCPDCATTDLQLSITGEGLTRTVKVSFKGEKPNKKATVDFRDGTSAQLANGESVSHTWPYGSYTVSASLGVNGLDVPCSATGTVTNNRQTCENYQAPTIVLQDNTTLTATQLTGSIGATPVGGSWSPAQAFPYNRPAYGQPALNLHFDYTVSYGPENLECRVSKGIDRSVPPKDPTCQDFQAPTITGDIASDIQPTVVNFSSGTVAPAGGSFANESLPASKPRPAANQPAGSFSTTYTLPYGPENLECRVQKTFTKPIPPQSDSCDNYEPPSPPNWSGSLSLSNQTTTQVTVNQGTISPVGTLNPTLPQVVNRPPAGQTASFSTTDTVTVPYGPEGLQCSKRFQHDFSIDIPPQQPACQPVHLGQPDGCYKPNPWGNGNNPEDVCGYFGLVPSYKDLSGSGDSYQFVGNATMVVVHWGGASCSQGAQSYSFTENATTGGTVINPAGNPGQGGFSYAQYCSCPTN